MKHSLGFTLLIVLIFLQVFALLTLNSLSQAAMLTKSSFDQYQADHLVRLAQAMLLRLEEQAPRNCLIAPLPAASLARYPLSWWQAHACKKTQENKVFYYTFEWLGRDQCGIIKQHNTSIEFYRLSLFVVHRNSEILLQSTIALPNSEKPVCKATPHFIAAGRQMYREIK